MEFSLGIWDYLHFGLALGVFILARLSLRPIAIRWIAVWLSVYLSTRYFWWRILFTLNTTSTVGMVISVSLLLAEAYGFLAAVLFYFQTLSPRESTLPPVDPDHSPSVDIMVTIYNEPLDILYRTLVACQAIDYPSKEVIICDDGQRDDVRQLAEELGCRYIRGPRNEDAKAGNLNHALGLTNGDLVLTFDIDHIPVRSFLGETVGFFQDPKVVLVQTAHHFHNPDIFQKNLRVKEIASNEQDMFFHVVQAGRNRWNASFYCGSGAVLRRSALEEIGGFLTDTVTEDIHTSIALHGRGYRSVYVNKDLAAGLAPEDFSSYLHQRQRWARGCFQVFLRANPLWARGLTLSQRICYFASIFYFLHGLPRLIFLLAPLTYLLFNQYPLRAGILELISYYLPHMVAFVSVLPAITRVFRKTFWADIYETVMCLPLTVAFFGVLFKPRKREFAVTPKGLTLPFATIDLGIAWWLLVLGLLTAAGIWMGLYEFSVQGVSAALIINLTWTVYNFIILIASILAAYETPQLRTTPRVERQIPCEVKLRDGDLIETQTRDLSETGLSLDLEKIYSLSPNVEVVLKGDGEETRLRGDLTRYDRRRSAQKPSVGIRFKDLTEEQHRSIVRQMYSSPETWAHAHDRTEAGAFLSFWKILTSVPRARIIYKPMQRRSLRYGLQVDCEFRADGQTQTGRLLDMGDGGMAVELDRAIPEEIQEVSVTLLDRAGQSFEVSCTPVYQVNSPGGMKLGLRVLDPSTFSRWIAEKR
ncbi:MAG: glycosyltransferase [Acidobacteriota bacterium]